MRTSGACTSATRTRATCASGGCTNDPVALCAENESSLRRALAVGYPEVGAHHPIIYRLVNTKLMCLNP